SRGLTSEIEARQFVNKEVFYPLDAVDGDDLVGNITWDNFIGYGVSDENRGFLGTITGVDESTINVLLRVDYDGEELLIPAVEEFVTDVDHIGHLLTVSLPEGLIDLA
ncbi:16S rRNA-processing protein RimM, partial [gut metagenome]